MKDNSRGAYNQMSNNLYDQVIPYFTDNQTVLNIGCGALQTLEQMIKHNTKDVHITSLDILDMPKTEFVDEFFTADIEKDMDLGKKFDVVCFFELLEHIDNTDVLIKNCAKHMKDNGKLIFSFPNLSSIHSRIELLLGFQPHILEVSNEYPNFGTGIFGKINNSTGKSIHHIRGLTYRAVKEMLAYYGLRPITILGWEARTGRLFNKIPQIAPVNIFIAEKINENIK